jgi:hypothetical protein
MPPVGSCAQLLNEHGGARGDFREWVGLAVAIDPSDQPVDVHLSHNIVARKPRSSPAGSAQIADSDYRFACGGWGCRCSNRLHAG